jgi:DNA modification methylase
VQLQLSYRSIDALLPYARNARTHSEAQVAQIAASIAEFGWTNPILIDGDNGVIAGHGRLLAARKLGLAAVPVIELAHLTPTQRRAYLIADNQLAQQAGWDDELLALELLELQQAGFDLNLTGFEGDEVTALLDKLVREDDDDERSDADTPEMADDIPAPTALAVSRPGDVWLLRRGDLEHRVLCADAGDAVSLEQLFQVERGALERASLCFTSPPYANQRNYTGPGANEGAGQWDRMMQTVCAAMPAVLMPDAPVLINLGLVHRDNEFQPYWDHWLACMRSNGWRRFGWYVWDQGPGLPGDWNGRLAPAFEFIFHFNRQGASIRRPNKNVDCLYAGRDTHLRGDGTSAGGMRNKDGSKTGWNHVGQVTQDTKIADSVLRIMRHKGKIGQDIDHPAVFPVALPQFVIECYSQAGEIVYEPFCGSGTSLLAAQRSGRRCYAVEIAPSYIDVTLKRFAQNYPEAQIVLASTGQSFTEVSAERLPIQQTDAATDELPDEVVA